MNVFSATFLPRMRVREKEPEDEHMERETDILEKNEGHDQREEHEEGEGECVNGEDCVMEQLVGQSISSTLT